ncbi:hypothetical protein PHYSODRAFT_258273 [Phytophthora sojae]|uniref:SCP domain-containing protein n=1 Tax=Phytophthora sojae (strain P6497) TaxID=1094619 RepID=G4YF66_PHYSP|nr:hypothetical protein PHYSODRAFT_258273 [Phytophthora sojae]EGZ27970.1 hypothetical protein PHYSODRAFT_258273 [Phytophthora sojae]|eukprot:XP_009515245.1 hypothetical protein PHYSODRAFT_258273 [Phytophthora sojae]
MALPARRSTAILLLLVVALLGCSISATPAGQRTAIGSAVAEEMPTTHLHRKKDGYRFCCRRGDANYAPASKKSAIGSAVAEELANTTPTRHLQTYSSTEFQTLMLNAVNKQRTAYGLSKLCINKKPQTAAQGLSSDMAAKNYMSHTGSDGSTMSQRITAAANILSSKYTMFGCGYAYKSGTTYLHYWTQDFAYGSTESCS